MDFDDVKYYFKKFEKVFDIIVLIVGFIYCIYYSLTLDFNLITTDKMTASEYSGLVSLLNASYYFSFFLSACCLFLLLRKLFLKVDNNLMNYVSYNFFDIFYLLSLIVLLLILFIFVGFSFFGFPEFINPYNEYKSHPFMSIFFLPFIIAIIYFIYQKIKELNK